MPPPASLPPSVVRSAPVRVLVVAMLAGAVLFGVARVVDGHTGGVTSLHPGLLAAAAVVWTGALGCQALRWRALLPEPARVSRAGLAVTVIGANVLNLALPGPTGELAAAWVLHRRWGVPLTTAVVTSLLARVLALVTLGGWLFLVSLCLPLEGGPAASGIRIGGIVGGLGALALVVGAFPGPLLSRLAWALEGGPGAKVGLRLQGWAAELTTLGHLPLRSWFAAAAWSSVNAALLAVAVGLAYASAGLGAGPVTVVYAHLLGSLSAVAALAIPGGIGAMDAVYGMVPALAEGWGAGDAVRAALAVRGAQVGSMVLSLPAVVWVVTASARSRR